MFTLTSLIKRYTIVKKIPVFSSLNWFKIQTTARAGEIIRYKKGELISRSGTSPDYVYFLISGRLRSYTLASDGHKDDIEFIHRGMFFGIISALTGEEHSQTFEAINDSILFRIQVDKFRKLLKRLPELGVKFSKVLSQRIRSKVTKTDLVSKTSIISVYAPMSSCGGSTYTLNLALTIQKETRDRVLLINIHSNAVPLQDPVGPISEISPRWKLPSVDLRSLAEDFETNVQNALIRSEFGIDLLSVAFDPQDIDVVQNMSDFVNGFIHEYRYIIVDLPSDMDDVVIKTLSQSDAIHLVMSRNQESLVTGRGILNRLEECLDGDFNADRIKVIVGGVDIDSELSEPVVRSLLDFDILAFLPHISREDLTDPMDMPAMTFVGIAPDCSYQKALTRVVRQLSGVSVGLVLGGGAAFGLAHIGVLKVLEEENIPVDIVVGSSMGALIGGLWAIGYSSADLTIAANEFRKKSNLIKLLDFVFPLSGLISGKAIMAWLRAKYGEKTFRDTRVPLKVVAYDLIHRRDIILETGLLVDAVRKSISIPGVFQPIIEKDQVIIDGGVMNPLPTNILAKTDTKRIIAVNVLQNAQDVVNSYHAARAEMDKSLEVPFLADPWIFIEARGKVWINKCFFPNISDIIVRTLEASEAVIADTSARSADVVIHPDLSGLQWFELYEVDTLIKRGEDAARAQLPRIREMILGRNSSARSV